MRRDEVIKALGSQRLNTDVQILIGRFLLDVESVTYVEERDSIVLGMRGDDLRDAIDHVVSEMHWWRGSLREGRDCPAMRHSDPGDNSGGDNSAIWIG